MILIYLIFTAFAFPDSVDIHLQAEEQVLNYVKNLESGHDEALNLWALHEIAIHDCNTLKLVKDQLKDSTHYSGIYADINCSDLVSADSVESITSDDILLKYWEDEILSRYNEITQNQRLLSKEDLGYNEFPLIHFKLLMGGNHATYYSLDSPEYLEQALESWIEYIRSYEDTYSLEHAIIVSNIIRVSYLLDRYDLIEEYDEVFLKQTLLPNSIHKLRLLGAIDYTYYRFGHFDKSLDLQREFSLPLAEFLGESNMVFSIKNRQGAYLHELGKYQESKNIYEELYNNSETFENQYTLFTNLGAAYLKLGQANRYISFQLRALDQKEEIENYRSLLGIYRNLFIYYVSIKDNSTALSYIDEAKEIAVSENDSTELALIDFYLGSFYWSSHKDHQKALIYLDAAEEILSPEQDYSTYVNLLLEKGTILYEIDSLNSALSIFTRVHDLTLSKSDTPNYIDALVNLTAISLKKGELDKVSSNLEEIKLYSLDEIEFQLLTKYYTVKADYYSITGDKRAAIEELAPVLEQVVDRAKNNTDSQQGYWSVEDEYLDAFELMVHLYIEDKQPEKALLLLDQLKTINDASLYNSPLIKAEKLSEEELVEEKRLNEKLQLLRKRYLNADEDERFAIKTEIDRTSALREQILSEVNLNKERSLPPVWSIQRSVQPNELLLHFTEIGSHLYVSYLTQENVKIRVLDFSKETQDRFNHIADELASGRANLNHLYELYQQLELHNIPKNIEYISVVPDNYLYRIPLEVLPTEEPSSAISFGSSRYLIEDFSFRYFTSLQEFEDNRRSFTNSTKYDYSGFAISNFKNFENTSLPSLPYATVENRNINSVLTSFDDKQMFNENEATKEAFKNRVGSSRLVHVATHSEVSEKDPLFSIIYLKSSNPLDSLDSDQALYAYELFDTPLNSEFIMLNSCSSGSGSYMQGTGVMGISRALRYAGAKSLALNLWSVNDKVASEFATDFYSFLNEGATKSEAFREAKLNQLRSSNANPHFWGAYMLIGNPSPVTNNSSNNRYLLFSLLAFTAIFAGFSAYQNATSIS
ncbi:MAG TPA: CHAT domain-containing protein [Gracilimonas sp.]|uniref:CHAT domain-containing protein n=1 Tax=Gracilimonas sp. TaxID=1974203 RepID=UPI002D9F2B3A|nr:CHAT domain-containing protein [Gracilimonas sp.]